MGALEAQVRAALLLGTFICGRRTLYKPRQEALRPSEACLLRVGFVASKGSKKGRRNPDLNAKIQFILASLDQGVREGRTLLHDWLVILTAQYNDACKVVRYEHGTSTNALIDVAFTQCPQLQHLPRLVFALLRNPLLRLHEEGVHPDYRIYLQCLFSALEPSSLQRAVYPLVNYRGRRTTYLFNSGAEA